MHCYRLTLSDLVCECVCVFCVAVCAWVAIYMLFVYTKRREPQSKWDPGDLRRLKCFIPCLSAMKPVVVCCQSYQREWKCPRKGMAKLQYIRTINYPDNNNECFFPDKSLAILSLSSWHRRRCQADIGPHSNQIGPLWWSHLHWRTRKKKETVSEGYGTGVIHSGVWINILHGKVQQCFYRCVCQNHPPL